MTAAYEIGKRYLVPTVKAKVYERERVVVCPAHGLQWRVATGELVPHEAVRLGG